MAKKPSIGFFSFTCCTGCEFSVLFIDGIWDILEKFNIEYFHLLKEKNREADYDLAFVEGAITSKREIEKLKRIRKQTKFLVAMGACATHGGIPSQRNFIEKKELEKYVYNQKMLKDSIDAQPISNFVNVDYFMYGCPIIQTEFVEFIRAYLKGKKFEGFKGPVCLECPRRGKDCFLNQKIECLGAITHGGCKGLCTSKGVPCTMCRGPLESANFANEVKLLESFGLPKKEILNKLRYFTNFSDGKKK